MSLEVVTKCTKYFIDVFSVEMLRAPHVHRLSMFVCVLPSSLLELIHERAVLTHCTLVYVAVEPGRTQDFCAA